jgi:hypothetical protein
MNLIRYGSGIFHSPPGVQVPIEVGPKHYPVVAFDEPGTDFGEAFGRFVTIACEEKSGGGRFLIFLDDSDRERLKRYRADIDEALRAVDRAVAGMRLTVPGHDESLNSDEYWCAARYNKIHESVLTDVPDEYPPRKGTCRDFMIQNGICVAEIRTRAEEVPQLVFCIDVIAPPQGDWVFTMLPSTLVPECVPG